VVFVLIRGVTDESARHMTAGYSMMLLYQ
jgi:hypothetical protein